MPTALELSHWIHPGAELSWVIASITVESQGARPPSVHGLVIEASTSQKFWAEAKEVPARSRMAEIDFMLEYGEVKRIVLRSKPWGRA